MSQKYSINLLQAELLTKQPLLSLKRLVLTWVGILIVMLIIIGIGQFNLIKATKKHHILSDQKTLNNTKQIELTTQLQQRKSDPVLIAKLSTLKLLTQHKKILHANLTDGSKTYVAGFAKVMTELSKINQANISLDHIKISHNSMSFSGIARSPEAVPLWMAHFKQTKLLTGKVFKHFKLSENKRHYTEFVVSTSTGENKVK